MEWDKIKQKWTEMTARVQSPPLRTDKRARVIKAPERDGTPAADTPPDPSSDFSRHAADERSTV